MKKLLKETVLPVLAGGAIGTLLNKALQVFGNMTFAEGIQGLREQPNQTCKVYDVDKAFRPLDGHPGYAEALAERTRRDEDLLRARGILPRNIGRSPNPDPDPSAE